MASSFSPEDIVGVWHLVSFRERRKGNLIDVFGPLPKGTISYSDQGHMSAILADPRRPRLKGEWADVPHADKAANYDGLVAYAGRYTLDGNQVRHHVDLCWIPNWEGRDLVRDVSFEGRDLLVLRTAGDPTKGQPPQEVIWERAQPFAFQTSEMTD